MDLARKIQLIQYLLLFQNLIFLNWKQNYSLKFIFSFAKAKGFLYENVLAI